MLPKYTATRLDCHQTHLTNHDHGGSRSPFLHAVTVGLNEGVLILEWLLVTAPIKCVRLGGTPRQDEILQGDGAAR